VSNVTADLAVTTVVGRSGGDIEPATE
jgi:hypothetical protein